MKDSAEFTLIGYLYGALIAIELARLLEAKNLTERLILIDGIPDQLEAIGNHLFSFIITQDFQNNVILRLMDMFYSLDNMARF